ncbi:flagellar basal-body rod protein FlgB [Cucumis melo var. makuwa]|uniref:Flagellar basal-body rod protein FlgB n=1 Tax=Cucumis melo var. makuwa TaxID=1194695 RepID=A0A5D3DRG2_CUCMM|nr:flagellar basal-body rod protein FlgB [Cucumis melo var. makuwa]
MVGNKNVDQSEKKDALSIANSSERDIKIMCFDGTLLKQAQLASSSHNETLPISSEVFGTDGWNPFNLNGKEMPIIDENIV